MQVATPRGVLGDCDLKEIQNHQHLRTICSHNVALKCSLELGYSVYMYNNKDNVLTYI